MRALFPHRELKYSDWGLGVTICVALVCNDKRSIVCVSDGKADFGDFSADGIALKLEIFSPDCIVLIAGNDVEYAPSVLSVAREKCFKEESGDLKFCGPELAALHVHETYLGLLQRQIENKVLRRHGFTLNSFRETGKDSLTPEVFASLHHRMEQVRISLQFMICGFDEKADKKRNPSPRIISVSGVGIPEDRSEIGMWAIGSGNHLAMSSLMFAVENRNLHYDTSLANGIYTALEAKYMAESNSLVGRRTATVIIEPNRLIAAREDATDRIKKIWKRLGAPRIPKKELAKLVPPDFLFDVRVRGKKKK